MNTTLYNNHHHQYTNNNNNNPTTTSTTTTTTTSTGGSAYNSPTASSIIPVKQEAAIVELPTEANEAYQLIKELCGVIWQSIQVDKNYFECDGEPNLDAFVQLFLENVGPIDQPGLVQYLEDYIDVMGDLNSLTKEHFKSIDLYYKRYVSVLKNSSFEPCTLNSMRCKSKKNNNLAKDSTKVLRDWFISNLENPYPTQAVKEQLSNLSGLSVHQVSNWFINSRRRNLARLRKQHNIVVNDEQAALQESNAAASGN
ncbi:hypothetical protein SAMD00019534_003850 [Acytostelium subglobosum LB1]|uniref:hypothetical protein n=1 Tax=Acytostelium subglobosum LB1 TaxID=1410327 RepID=UPI00064513B2|nr:hypothetical protein SAMD00019534_003850 [Acytostelium subglobosum LB1]GAM17210.1 hypothetical protein SAMD00019534_003850 [Acytostelium subglobosum LB1]|eukprot:XP_012759272.1 hypothetical protein SAMD00019534_003850 [Acytostelium subglobosum LB1]